MEEWKDIQGYEGLYKVSNKGRVYSTSTGTIITPKTNNKGYHHIILCKSGEKKSFLVHRLVASAFIPCKDPSLTVNHIDENRTNNEVENLEWCTLSQNIKMYNENHPDRFKHRQYKGSRNRSFSKRLIKQMTKDGTIVRMWESITDIKHTLNYNNWSISQCCDNKRKSAYGYIWQYAV